MFLSLLATSYNWEGTCAEDSSMVCFDADGWTMYGTQCEKKCEGVPTNKQVDKIHQECDEKSRQKFIQGGGHATEWDMSRDNGAAEVRGMLSPLPLHVQFCMCLMFTHIVFLFVWQMGVKTITSCFDKQFEAKGYRWEGTCRESSTEVCYEGGSKMYGGWCDCVGVVTAVQIDAIDIECNKNGQRDFVKGGGDSADWDAAKADGAALAGSGMFMGCFEKEFESLGYSWEGTCRTKTLVKCGMGGWADDYTECDCQGVITQSQSDAIDAKCDQQAFKKFTQSGGDVKIWEMEKEQGAMDAGAKILEGCVEKSFKDNNYNWMGTCKGDATLECSNDGWTNLGTICECENVVTEAQLTAVQDKCDKQAEREFNKAGGDAQEWEEKKTQGAMLVMSSSLKSCFNKQMEKKSLSWTGVCQDAVYLNQECKYDRVEMMSKMVKTSTFSGMYCMECTGTTIPRFW